MRLLLIPAVFGSAMYRFFFIYLFIFFLRTFLHGDFAVRIFRAFSLQVVCHQVRGCQLFYEKDTLSEEATLSKNVLVSLRKRASSGAKSFLLEQTSLQTGIGERESKQEVTKVPSLLK